MNVEAAGHCDDYLLQPTVCVPCAHGPAWHIVQVEDSPDVEWYVTARFDKCEISARVRDPG
jgi:hypothetical protein